MSFLDRHADLGVVIEAQVESGVDYLAAYADRSGRHFNYSGAE